MKSQGQSNRVQQHNPSHTVSTPDVSAKSRHTLGSESATLLLGSLHSNGAGGSDTEEGTPSIIAIPASSVSHPTQEQAGVEAIQQEADFVSLSDRLPMVGDVLDELKRDYHVQKILDTPGVFHSQESRDSFISKYFHHIPGSGDFWDDASEYMLDALTMNIPTAQSEVKRCKDEYECDVAFILDQHFAQQLPTDVLRCDVDVLKLRCISKRIGFVFVETFERMIGPPSGKKIVSIVNQLEVCLNSLSNKPLDEYFDSKIAQHVYYVAGYLCHAGKKAASKRRGDLGKCIGAISSHFVTTAAEVDAIKLDLPAGIAELVDSRAVHGLLSYPDRQFYSLIARIEYCYVELATPNNLMVFGGGVLASICDAIISEDLFMNHFTSLFGDTSPYDESVIQEAFGFYVKVFSNLRLKDLCRKSNSRLSKTNTVGIRQSLAVNRKPTNAIKRRKREELLEDEEPTEEQLHLDLEMIAERGLDDDSDIAQHSISVDDNGE